MHGCLCSVCDRKEPNDLWLKHLLLFGRCRLSGVILSSALPTKPECLIWEFWKVLDDLPILNLEFIEV
jgi:hypothetical protein